VALHRALCAESFAEKERRLSEMILQLQMLREQLLQQQQDPSKVSSRLTSVACVEELARVASATMHELSFPWAVITGGSRELIQFQDQASAFSKSRFSKALF
jgi:hypothetical protein